MSKGFISWYRVATIGLGVVMAFWALWGALMWFDGYMTSRELVAELEVPCENNKVLLVFTDGEVVERYAGLSEIHSGVFIGHGQKMVVQMLHCNGGVVGQTYIAANQSFQLVDE